MTHDDGHDHAADHQHHDRPHDQPHDHNQPGPFADLGDEERIRRAGHIILDGVTAADAQGVDPDVDPMELAFSHLLEIEAIALAFDEAAEEVELDISPLMGGVMLVVRRLVAELAVREGVSQESVVMAVRAAIDDAV